MAELPLDEAVARFHGNEDRINKFVNAPGGEESFQTSGGESVPVLPKMIEAVTAQADRATVHAQQALDARDETILNALIADDVADGLSKTSDTDPVEPTDPPRHFRIFSPDGDESFIYYRHDAGGVATERGRLSSDGAVKKQRSRIDAIEPGASPLRRVPRSQGFDALWAVVVGGKLLGYFDENGVWRSDHDHTGLQEGIQALAIAERVNLGAARLLPLSAGSDVVWGVALGDKLLGYFDSAGIWHSDHSHPDLELRIAGLESSFTSAQEDIASGALGGNSTGYLAFGVTVGGEQQVMIHDGSEYSQLTPGGSNWYAPLVHNNNIVRALSDHWLAGQLEPTTILPTGEIVPETSIVSHMIVYGQSLALGSRGFIEVNGEVEFGTVFTTEDSVHGLLCSSFQSGPRIGVTFDSFIPIKESFDGSVLGETMCSSLLNARNDWLLENAYMRQRLLASSSGLGGTAYSGLKKGTSPYNVTIAAVTGGKALAEAAGYRYHVPAIFIVHGESESGNILPATYAGYLAQWLTDFTTDITAITSQRRPPALMISQMNRQKSGNEGVTLGQLLAHEEQAGIVLYAPKYQHPYYDDAHPLAEAYVKQAELGERAQRHWMAGRKWQPLRPISVTAVSNVVTVQYNNTLDGGVATAGPVGPIILDTDLVTNPGNYGFACTDGSVSITGVAVGAGNTSIVITLSAPPAEGAEIEYAMQSELNLNTMPQGQNTGSRGNVRDSDTRDTSRFDSSYLYNWAVAFRAAIQ